MQNILKENQNITVVRIKPGLKENLSFILENEYLQKNMNISFSRFINDILFEYTQRWEQEKGIDIVSMIKSRQKYLEGK